jgi:hypothetical protein
VLRIFIALKNPSLWPGLNPRPLGPVASTLITTPLRQLAKNVVSKVFNYFNWATEDDSPVKQNTIILQEIRTHRMSDG